jgi:ABC-type ATPase involved in cell division
VLRKAGRTLYSEDVLSNIYSDGDRGPAATLVVKGGDAERREALDLEAEPPQCLSRICIADYRAGEIYLKEETEVDYVPATLASLSRLATGLMEVKAELQRRRNEVDVPDIDPRLFGEGTRTARFMAALQAGDSEEDLRELATLAADEERTRVGLRKTLAEIEAMQAPQLRAAAERDVAAAGRLRRELEEVGRFVGADGVEEAQELEKALAVASEAAELAAQEFACEPLGAIGSDPWRLLWSAAREYAAHLGQALPADHDPAHCPLCMQELSPAGRARLHSFEEFVTGDVSNRLTERREKKEAMIAALPDTDAVGERHLDTIERLGTEPGDLGFAITGWLAAARSRLDLLREGEVSDLTPLGAPPDLGKWIAAREEEAARQTAIEADEGHEEVRARLAELEGRRRLAGRLDDALARLRALQKIARIKVAIGQTGTGTVSQKVRSLSQELIQAGLGKALAKQLAALEFRDIEVVPKSRIVRGKPVAGLVFKAVGGVPLTDVLSQGEQRRLALAMFLAEMEVRSDVSPVVFDDPTSSIDQEGRRRIARTLMKLGESRQVIVFTHELSLVQELQRHTSSACAVHAQHIKRLGKTVGHVQSELPWDGLPAKARRGQLEQRYAALKTKYEQNDDESYAKWAADFCNRLRAAFERAVEDSVLAGVVTRRRDDVQTKSCRRSTGTRRSANWSTVG